MFDILLIVVDIENIIIKLKYLQENIVCDIICKKYSVVLMQSNDSIGEICETD